MNIEEIIKTQIVKYKEEFTERPEEYVHGDYISFLSHSLKSSIQDALKEFAEEVRLSKKLILDNSPDNLFFREDGYNQAVADQSQLITNALNKLSK